jgi:hypothetical protein
MDVSFATSAAPGGHNEDLVIAGEDFLVVLDGVTSPAGIETGCVHDPRWLVHALGSALTVRLSGRHEPGLAEVLADAIVALRAAHGGACDLGHPESPSSTVVLLRERAEEVDYLVLCDSSLVLADPGGGILRAVTDDRTAAVRGLPRPEIVARRNQPGGFWVASTDPLAAREALTGALPVSALGSALACTDGVSRLVEYFGHDWSQVLARAAGNGPRDLVRAVRAQEAAGTPPGARKQYDDATAALCLFPPTPTR